MVRFVIFFMFSLWKSFTGAYTGNSVGGISDEDILYQLVFWFNKEETSNAYILINWHFLGFRLRGYIFF